MAPIYSIPDHLSSNLCQCEAITSKNTNLICNCLYGRALEPGVHTHTKCVCLPGKCNPGVSMKKYPR